MLKLDMNLNELTAKAIEIRDKYDLLNKADGHKKWEIIQYMEGFVGDVGDLMKLVMAKSGYRRHSGKIDELLRHELADCLWSVLVIAKKLDINLEEEFTKTMKELDEHISKNLK